MVCVIELGEFSDERRGLLAFIFGSSKKTLPLIDAEARNSRAPLPSALQSSFSACLFILFWRDFCDTLARSVFWLLSVFRAAVLDCAFPASADSSRAAFLLVRAGESL